MECMIPPWVRPESPETIRWIDDATASFAPAFGRGMTQRGIWADPRWGIRRRYRGLRSDQKAAIISALSETRGQLNILRVTPHTPLRGTFPTSELLTNNTFGSGTTGWTAGGSASISSADRILRVLQTSGAASANPLVGASSMPTVVQYAPYALRGFLRYGRTSSQLLSTYIFDSVSGAIQTYGAGLQTSVAVMNSTTPSVLAFYDDTGTTPGRAAGDFFDVSYASFARCALIDNAPNYLIQSAAFENAAWTRTNLTSVTAGATTGPDGLSSGDSLVENNTVAGHNVSQAITVTSAAQDLCFAAIVKAGARGWVRLLMDQGASNNGLAFFNLTTGAVGTTSGWTNIRTAALSLGDGWWYLALVARKATAGTTITCYITPATADNTPSYAGNGSAVGIYLYAAAAAPSSVPMRASGTGASAVTTGTTQSGSALFVKGLPASTSSLLLTGDWIEINGELKQIAATVNSDSAGFAYVQFRPSLAGSPADNDPMIVNEPFGRFVYPGGTRELENLFGIYGDCEMNLEEIYS